MARFGVEDIDALIGRGAGDAGALREIRRALERGEVVSASERDYVMRLMARHMGPGPRTPAPGPEAARAPSRPARHDRRGPRAMIAAARARVARRPSRRTIAVAAVAVAVIVSVAISVQGARTDAPAGPAPGASLLTDRPSYAPGEMVVISGRAEPGAEVALSIVGPGGPVWNRTVMARADGSYSAMEFAGGAGWVEGEHAAFAAGAGVNASVAFAYGAAP